MRTGNILGLLLTVGVAVALGEEVPGRTAKPPELKVLERLIGKWNTECTEKQGEKETRITATMTTDWMLDGSFLQCKGTRNPGKTENIQIIGFDSVKGEYRMWYFDSLGAAVGPVGGQWDENSKTLTWRGTPQRDVSLVNRERFVDNDTIEWRLVVSNNDGTVSLEQQGKSIRRK
jgi:hypothetical protein